MTDEDPPGAFEKSSCAGSTKAAPAHIQGVLLNFEGVRPARFVPAGLARQRCGARRSSSGRGFILRCRFRGAPDQPIRMPFLKLHVVFKELPRIVIELGGDPAPDRSDLVDYGVTQFLR
jgi:hypothetical protein